MGFLLPRAAVDNELETLGDEFVELDKILGPFQELATGTRDDLQIRSISSSGFQVYVLAAPGLALAMSKVFESLLSSYQKILEIRETHERLKNADVPDKAVQGIIDHANERMAIDIDALAEELIAEFGERVPAGGRLNELRVEITHSLSALANRIDEGYSIEVRAGELPEAPEDLPEGVSEEAVGAAQIIGERQPRMRYLNLSGTRILELPEGDDGQAGDRAPDDEG